MERRDWVLMSIASAAPSYLEPVQLQKSLFLIGENLSKKEIGTADYFKFRPYDYGPFSADVYHDAEELQAQGLVVIARAVGSGYRKYAITEAGRYRAAAVREGLSAKARDYVGKVVEYVTSLSFDDLVTAIYRAYPSMRANSVFRGAR